MPAKRRGSVSARLSVWFSLASRAANAARSVSEYFEPAGVEGRERRLAATQCSDARRLVPASVNASVPARELEDRERDPGRRLRAALEPAQPAGDHQVQDEKPFVVEREDDPLAEPPHVDHAPAFGLADRRHGGAQHERIAGSARARAAAERMRDGERVAVDVEVGKLRHRRLENRRAASRRRAARSGDGLPGAETAAGSIPRAAMIASIASTASNTSAKRT